MNLGKTGEILAMKPIIEKQPPHVVTELVGCEVFRRTDFACVWDQHPEVEITLVLHPL